MLKNVFHGKKGNANIFPVIVITAGLILIAAILAVVLFYWNIGRDGGKISEKDFNGPQEIIDYSIKNTLSQKTYSIEGDLRLDMGIRSTETAGTGFLSIMPDYRVAYKLNFNEIIDQSEIGNERSSANVGLNIIMSSEGGSDDYSANFDVMLFGKDFAYLKLNDFDLGMMGFILGAQAKQYKGKWYELDLKKMRKESEGDFSFDKYSSEEVTRTLERYDVIKFAEDMGEENIDGINIQRYKAKVDPQALVGYYKVLLDMRDAEARGNDLKKITSETAKEFDELMIKYYGLISKVLEKVDIDIWIGKKDFLVRKMSINADYDKDFVGDILKKYVAEEQVRSRLRSNDLSVKYYTEREKDNLEKYYSINKRYEGYKKTSSWGSLYSDSVNINLNSSSYVVWSRLKSTDDIWCMDSAGREGYVPLDFSQWDCSGASVEPKGKPKDISDLIDKEAESMKAEMDFTVGFDLSFGKFNVPAEINRPENVEDMAKILDNI